MAKVKLNLRNLSIPEKAAKARQIVAAMTGNINFPTPQPALTQITTAVDELDAAYADQQAAKQTAITRTNILNEKSEMLDGLLRQAASYVESISGTNEKQILSAGFSIRSAASALLDPVAPAALDASAGNHDGEIVLTWEKVKGAKSYVIERNSDPPVATSWTHAGVSLKSSAKVNNLVSGTRYWFRVAAVTSGGQSGWSDPATKIAP